MVAQLYQRITSRGQIQSSALLLRLRRRVRAWFAFIIRVSVFVAIALAGGILSSWYAVERGTKFNTERQGPWTRWSSAGRPDSDPYARVRFDRRGALLLSANLAARYEAVADSEGRLLHSSCDYILEGGRFSDGWWSVAVFDSTGRLIPNAAERHAFNAATAAREADGSMRIYLSREAKPYNWLPTARGGRLVIVAEIHQESGVAKIDTDAADSRPVLPSIKRTSCR
ncbi:MAG TPA: DUF1214 domain-containing protein [Hyphomicrobiaceae bacterium]|nr:DUF1214 domain-containing protein [Hyphomicrobiaceae bacterium]